jgi:hypothetical protein
MPLSEVMEDTFVMLSAGWTVAFARRFLRGVAFTHVIVQRLDRDFWYLFRREHALGMLTDVDPSTRLTHAFNLHEYAATTARDSSSDADTAPDQVVVLHNGRAVGFFDAETVPSEWARSERSRQESATRDDGSFTAYPALSMPAAVAPETPFDITVGFRDTPDPDLTDSGAIHVEHVPPRKECLVVLVGDGVALDREHDTLPLRVNALLRFIGQLKTGVKDATVKALFFLEGQLIGTAKRQVALVGAAPEPASDAGCPFKINQPLPQSSIDFWVCLTCLRDGTLVWRLAASGIGDRITERKFTTTLPDTKQFAADLMSDLKTQNHRGVAARAILETIGREITDLMPREFFDVLAEVHKRLGCAPTLLLLTDENYVPWELAYLESPLDPAAPPFLAAQVQMGRWLADDRVMLPPAVALEVKRITAVAAQYGLGSGQRELKEAMAEQKALRKRWQAIPLSAVRPEIDAMIGGAKIPGHLVHFAVHGYGDPTLNAQMLLLADGTRYPARAFTGGYAPGQTPRFAFVFLNACQVGAPGRTLGHAGGFPPTLIRAGTLGFIAPLWDVDDDVARSLAEAFYSGTFERNESVGAALRSQRRAYTDASTTPMAYIYYGHPGLRLQFVPPRGRNDGKPDGA